MSRSFALTLVAAAMLGFVVVACAQDHRQTEGQYRDPYSQYQYGARAFDDGIRQGEMDRVDGGYRGRAYGDPGYQRGYDDGRRDGQRDRETGHSFRPTKSDNYEDADRGYHSSFGDKKYYKRQYRRGYVNGYQDGYGSRGYYDYRR